MGNKLYKSNEETDQWNRKKFRNRQHHGNFAYDKGGTLRDKDGLFIK